MKGVTLFFLLFICSFLAAKEYNLTNISGKNGLSQQDVECMFQDKHGFLWIGTYDGLNKYDGKVFELFRHSNIRNSISDNRIIAMCEWNKRDEIWVGTDDGIINYYNQKTNTFSSIYSPKYKPNSKFMELKEIRDTLWICTSKGLIRITENKDSIRLDTININNPVTHAEVGVNTIASDNQGNLILGTQLGLYFKRRNEHRFIKVQGLNIPIVKLMPDRLGNLFALTTQGIYYYSLSHQRTNNYLSFPYIIDFSYELPSFMKSIIEVKENLMIIATEKRLYWLEYKYNTFDITPIRFEDSDFFKNNIIKSLMMDRSENVWVTSAMAGLAKFDLNSKDIKQVPLDLNNKDNKHFVQVIKKIHNNEYWIGTNRGLFILDKNLKNVRKSSLIQEMVIDILEDKDRNVWITFVGGVYYLPLGNDRDGVELKPDLGDTALSNSIEGHFALVSDDRGNILVGTRSGLLTIKKEKEKFGYKLYADNNSNNWEPSGNIAKLYYDSKNQNLLIGTVLKGLLKANLKDGQIIEISSLTPKNNGRQDHVWSIYNASDGNIYIGTDSGLKKIQVSNGSYYLSSIDFDERLSTYKIASIYEDDDKNLWITTSFGLLKYNLDTKQIDQFFDSDIILPKNWTTS